MPVIVCPKSIHGIGMRVTRTDVCGVPESHSTPFSRAYTSGFISYKATPNLESGTEITVKKADGQLCVTDKLPDILKWLDVELELCGVPPHILDMLLGTASMVDEDGNTVGGVLPPIDANGLEVAQVELFSVNKEAAACATGFPYVHWVFPLTRNWQLTGDTTIGDAAVNFTIKGLVEASTSYEPSEEAEWTDAQVAQIQAGGPMAWKAIPALPTHPVLNDCAYAATGS